MGFFTKDIPEAADDAWDATGGEVLTCGNTGAARVLGVFSIIPPFGSSNRKSWAAYGQAGNISTLAGIGVLAVEKRGLTGLGALGFRVAGKASLAVTVGATLYDSARRWLC